MAAVWFIVDNILSYYYTVFYSKGMMKKKIIFLGGLIGLCSEFIYLFSIMGNYPYSYIHVLLPLSFMEGATILFILSNLNLLKGKLSYVLSASLYLVVRVIARAFGITVATGASLLIEKVIPVTVILKMFIIVISFAGDIIFLLIVLTPLLYVAKKIVSRKQGQADTNAPL